MRGCICFLASAGRRLLLGLPVARRNDRNERAFFEWLDRMPFVSSYHGVVRDLFIDLNRVPTYDDLWEIIGFFQALWRRSGPARKICDR